MAGRPPIDVTRVVQELVQLAEAAGLRDDPAVQRRIRAVAATRDVRLAETMRRALLPRATERVLGGNPFPPTVDENLHSGVKPDRSVLVGVVQDVLHAAPFFFDVDSLCAHVFVAGASGSGKTNLLIALALQLMAYCVVWVVDRDKQDFRHIRRLVDDLRVLNPTANFCLNPLKVIPPMSPREHLVLFVTVFTKATSLLDGSESLLYTLCTQLYQERGVFDGSDNFPTLHDLLFAVKALKLRPSGRDANFQSSIANRLEQFLATSGDLCSYVKGYSVLELARHNLVWRLSR